MELSYDESVKLLREWRNASIRKSKEVVEIGENVVKKSPTNDEFWLICEQVYISSLDIGRYDLADYCINKLQNNFPDSVRVLRLDAMKLEACGGYDDAMEVYEKLIERDPTNAGVRKRKVAVLKSQGKTSAAIRELCKYLNIFMADHEAWYELADLYVAEMDYEKAAFCYEELILINTFNHLYHQRFAEICYTMGDIEIAQKHFAQAVKLSSNTNMRALNGVLLCAYSMTSSKSPSKSRSARFNATWSAKMVLKKYEDAEENKRNFHLLANAALVLKQLTTNNPSTN